MERVYIYGIGNGADKYFNNNIAQYDILGFIVSDKKVGLSRFKEKDVFLPEEIINKNYDKIIIANEYVETYRKLEALGIPNDKIKIVYRKCKSDLMNETIENISNMFNTEIDHMEFIHTMKMMYDTPFNIDSEYKEYDDYVRYKVLELLAQEILNNNLEGSIAELGVFKGDFAKIINRLFPQKTLYLFDTFEGFHQEEAKHDVENNYAKKAFLDKCNYFKDTNIEIVMDKMQYKDKCIVRKGYFPQTTNEIEDRFSLVSIDVDLYEPIYNGLEYFYPRLVEGGYILLHDYNNKEFLGVKKAVKKYEEEYGKLKKVPLCDQGGTLVITK
jgi:uncharacterized protein YjgD (DUF1641 family)